MKLIIKRNQADVKGIFGGHKGVSFSLYGRCDITEQEKSLIAKYKVGGYVLAACEMKAKGVEPTLFRVTVDGIVAGTIVETDNIDTLLELESKMKDGCSSLKRLLAIMSSFGGEQVFDI